ncbi:MAG: hypothetical protein LBE79_01410 [Tannerella sp.]|jgi:hypothetical protein|nr:hypothetical protein [Tannerella sp.]
MNIEHLIHKFYEGETSPEEERLLSAYFLNDKHIDEDWKEDQQLFHLLNDIRIQVPSGVSGRLEASIEQLEVIGNKSLSHRRTLYYWMSSAAAILLLCIGLFFVFREPQPPKMADTFTDPEEAAIVARQALTYMSMQLNKGLNKVAEVDQELERIDQILNKHLGK